MYQTRLPVKALAANNQGCHTDDMDAKTTIMTAVLSELGKLGGAARAAALSPRRRREIARMGGIASRNNARKRKRRKKMKNSA